MAYKFPEYEPFFHKGLRIEIGIPQPSGDIFRDWAIVKEFKDDTLLVQLSRDYLPSNVRVNVSSILDASVWINQEIYTCTCIVTERQGERNLRIRLFGILTLKERRQFFRLECNFKYRYTEPDVRVRHEVEAEWQKRHELESMKYGGYDDVVIQARQAEFRESQLEHVWHQSGNNPVTLGGGGMGFKLDKKLKPETLMHVELTLPLAPPRTVHAVAEVVYVLEPPGEKPVYRTGFRFLHIDERDRDHIFRFISMLQLLRLREMSENRPFPQKMEKWEEPAMSLEQFLLRVVYWLVFLMIGLFIGKALMEYRERGDQSEIKQIYEKSIKKYRKEPY